jgi:hypothetical protein
MPAMHTRLQNSGSLLPTSSPPSMLFRGAMPFRGNQFVVLVLITFPV